MCLQGGVPSQSEFESVQSDSLSQTLSQPGLVQLDQLDQANDSEGLQDAETLQRSMNSSPGSMRGQQGQRSQREVAKQLQVGALENTAACLPGA